jgi:hypothetical protein
VLAASTVVPLSLRCLGNPSRLPSALGFSSGRWSWHWSIARPMQLLGHGAMSA